MPLHREHKAGRVLDADGLRRVVGGPAVDAHPGAGAHHALTVQRVGHHPLRSKNAREGRSGCQADLVPQREFLLQRPVRRHAVVHPPRKVADLGMQRRAERHRDFLEPATETQDRLAALDRGADERQGHPVAVAVEGAMRLGRLFAVLLRVHVGPAAGQQEAVERVEKLVDRPRPGVGGKAEGHAVRDTRDGIGVHPAVRMGRVLVVEQVGIGDDADDRSACHASDVTGPRHRRLAPAPRDQASPRSPATSIPASPASASWSDVSPVTPTEPTTCPFPSRRRRPPGTGTTAPP